LYAKQFSQQANQRKGLVGFDFECSINYALTKYLFFHPFKKLRCTKWSKWVAAGGNGRCESLWSRRVEMIRNLNTSNRESNPKHNEAKFAGKPPLTHTSVSLFSL
jgi:hypothetical protein